MDRIDDKGGKVSGGVERRCPLFLFLMGTSAVDVWEAWEFASLLKRWSCLKKGGIVNREN